MLKRKYDVNYKLIFNNIVERFKLKDNEAIAKRLKCNAEYIEVLKNDPPDHVPQVVKESLHYIFGVSLEYMDGKDKKMFLETLSQPRKEKRKSPLEKRDQRKMERRRKYKRRSYSNLTIEKRNRIERRTKKRRAYDL